MMPPSSAPPTQPQPHYLAQPPSFKTEKEKMLHGEPFLPYDDQLMEERAHCLGAVYSFNSTASPSVVIGRGDRERNFKRIVAAGWIHPRHMDRRPGALVGGHLGGNVNVTTPFHCDYGYNISIAENVSIGPHCQFLDSARIAIGRNTKIGARVTISTLKTPTDTKSIKGSNGTEIAKEVFIGENVYIGDGVIIEAGVKIGHNAIVRAGSVVVQVSTPRKVMCLCKLTTKRTSRLMLLRVEIRPCNCTPTRKNFRRWVTV
jgi:acetyltransferase-like isoleucine patch superfamily enzyme